MSGRGFRRAVADGWVRLLHGATHRAPWLARILKPLVLFCTFHGARGQHAVLMANAGRLLGPGAGGAARRRLAKRVLSSAFDSVLEFASNRGLSEEGLSARLASVSGEEEYLRTRALQRGAILVTAHLGSFEAAMGLLRRHERMIHVVFKRDPMPVYERLRREQHARLGVIEAPVDDGLETWVRLRDALGRDEVVLMQADRVMPGQPGMPVPFLGGHARLPTGPVKLARLTGAPVIPVFAIGVGSRRGGVQRMAIELHPAIWPSEMAEGARSGSDTMDPALVEIARVVEAAVRAHPEQWLALHPALIEDEEVADAR